MPIIAEVITTERVFVTLPDDDDLNDHLAIAEAIQEGEYVSRDYYETIDVEVLNCSRQ